jgi:hypothetical protein
MEILSLDEIPDWKSFEDLVAAYFKTVKQDSEFDVIDVVVQQTGTGADGGRDILVKLTVDDSIMTYERIWVIQCKFHKTDINKKHLADINIPSLLHEYGAHGYLLVCKNSCTAPVSNMFEGFNSKCHLQRKYEIWNGNSLLQRVRVKNDLIGHYFPRHYAYLKQKEAEAEQILKQHG